MAEHARADLFLLKQYGFSEKLLDWLFTHSRPDELLMNAFSIDIDQGAKIPCTKKDQQIQQLNYFNDFIRGHKDELISNVNRNGFKMLFKYDKNVLDNFLEQKRQPLFMYLRGDATLLDSGRRRVAMVGTRNINDLFAEKVNAVVDKYLDQKYIVVSGLARGTDTLVHRRTILQGGHTLAVLPTNFDSIYPKENIGLAEQIFKDGLAMSAIGPHEQTYKSSFLKRNEYVAAISDEIVVIQTSLHSGTMNTIHHAVTMGKPVLYLKQDSEELNLYLSNLGATQINHC